jgi:putative FmdB family regulatory protein
VPIYDYDCAECGRRIEVVHGVQAPGPTHCPNCGGGPLKKAIAAPAVHFKGSGWAKRDRRTTVAPAASTATTDSPASTDGDSGDGGDAKAGSSGSGSDADTGSGGPAEKPAATPSKAIAAGTPTRTD